MRYIRYLVLAAIGVGLIVLALANRGPMTLNLLPDELAALLTDLTGLDVWGQSIELPVFVVIFLGVLIGVLLGFVWEWVREHKHRKEVSRKTREVGHLERELQRVKDKNNEGKDDVLALLEDAGTAR